MVDAGSMLRGRADRIDRVAGEVRIVDLKTGLHQGEPTEDQRRQLLLYAVLYERTNGEWPAALAIENASGEQVALPFDPAEAADALDEVLEAVTSFNALVTTKGPFTLLANPGAETCRRGARSGRAARRTGPTSSTLGDIDPCGAISKRPARLA